MGKNEQVALTTINDIEKLPRCILNRGVTFFLIMDCNSAGKLRIGYKSLTADRSLISVCVDNKESESNFAQTVIINGVTFEQNLITTSTFEKAVNILYGFMMTKFK